MLHEVANISETDVGLLNSKLVQINLLLVQRATLSPLKLNLVDGLLNDLLQSCAEAALKDSACEFWLLNQKCLDYKISQTVHGQ